MSESVVQASVFKARCLAMLDDVAENHRTIIVTKHGRPVAKVVPLESGTSMIGSVTLLGDDDDYFSTGETWDAT